MFRLANVQGRQVYTAFRIQYLGLAGVSFKHVPRCEQIKDLQRFIKGLGRFKNIDLRTVDLESWSYVIELVDQTAKR